MIARVAGVIAARTASTSRANPRPSGTSGTATRRDPAIAITGAYVSKNGSSTSTSEPGSTRPRTAAAIASEAPTVTSTSVSGSNCWP